LRAKLGTGTFDRYLKQQKKKGLITFGNELEIGYACEDLLNNELIVAQIYYEMGYSNLSNFNKHFKPIVHLTPSHYKNLHPENTE
jgi:AraC-like DNA-binding protein